MGQVPYGESPEARDTSSKAPASGLSFREALNTRQFWLVTGTFFCYGVCVLAITTHIVIHAIELGISATNAANILAAVGVVSIIGKLVLGTTADRIGHKQALIVSFILLVVALFWLAAATNLWALFAFAIVFGFAYGGSATSSISLVALLFGVKSLGLILALVNIGFTTGAAMGPLMAGYIFDITGSYQIAFIVSAIVGIIGLILTVLLAPTKKT
jgi:MFS family permease